MSLNLKNNKFLLGALLLTLVTVPVAYAVAVDSGKHEDRGERRGPPPEAIEACADLAEGDSCSFSGKRGDEEGFCKAPPNGDEGPLACAPEGGPPKEDK